MSPIPEWLSSSSRDRLPEGDEVADLRRAVRDAEEAMRLWRESSGRPEQNKLKGHLYLAAHGCAHYAGWFLRYTERKAFTAAPSDADLSATEAELDEIAVASAIEVDDGDGHVSVLYDPKDDAIRIARGLLKELRRLREAAS